MPPDEGVSEPVCRTLKSTAPEGMCVAELASCVGCFLLDFSLDPFICSDGNFDFRENLNLGVLIERSAFFLNFCSKSQFYQTF